jgi:hypothetical protein
MHRTGLQSLFLKLVSENEEVLRKQPTLRHFAVLELSKRSLFGNIWEVKDRRSASDTQLLFTPNRLIAWPRWVAHFGSSSSAIRLRNGKVAILLSRGHGLQELNASIQTLRKDRRSELEPLSGFVQTGRSKTKVFQLVVIACAAMVITAVYLFPRNSEQIRAVQNKTDAPAMCSNFSPVGETLSLQVKAHSTIKIANVQFRVLELQRFGGLTRFEIRRECDRKTLTADAWRAKDSLRISKVN